VLSLQVADLFEKPNRALVGHWLQLTCGMVTVSARRLAHRQH
jgi:hypothetical protein